MGKPESKKRQREGEDLSSAPSQDSSVHAPGQDPPPKKARVESSRTLFVRSLPPSATDQTLAEFFSQHYPVKHAIVVLDPKTKASRGYGFVTFTDEDDVVEAQQKLNNELLDGRRLRLDIAEPRRRGPTKDAPGATPPSAAAEGKRKREEALAEARKPPKLIVRNLPWSVKTADQLSALFRSYGKVKFADLPKSKGNKLSGFGFVTIRGRKNAEKAMESVNGKTIDGRTLAVDWAVDKSTWEREQDLANNTSEKQEAAKGGDEEDKTSAAEPKKPALSQEDADIANFMKNHMENLEEEEESGESSEEEQDQDSREESSNDLEDEDEDSDASEDAAEDKDKEHQRTTDNSTTIFIRNLPFTTTEEQLKTHFTQFGAIRYARVVMDRATDRPAGTGFVCFFSGEDCKECLKSAPRHRPAAATALGKTSVLQDETVDQDGRYTMEGRVLQIAQAVSKEEATKLASEGPGAKRNQDKDKRRLFLLSEGTITKSSPLYDLLAPSEVKLRQASEAQRKKLVQTNPSLHLSLTRLVVRNIPKDFTSKDLKALARQAVVGFAKDAKDGKRQPLSKEEMARGGQQDREAEHHRKEKGKGVIRQAKVVFESKEGSKVSDESAGRSRGYGFIEFWSHRWALMGLRWLNGHPLKNESGKTLRLVVEFAIENAQVVQRRKALEERTKNKGKTGAAGATNEEPGKGGSFRGNDAKGWKGKGGAKENVNQKSKSGKGEQDEDSTAGEKGSKGPDAKLKMRTQIIARKRLMRKKKASLRKGK